jgi:hypothetical protein
LLDPLFIRIVAMGFAVLFMLAAVHKLSNRSEFFLILRAYQVLPAMLLRPTTLIIPNLEIILAFGWFLIGVLGFQLRAVPVFSAGLLLVYAAAIAINLFRGRRDIDCGCSLASSKTDSSNPSEQISEAQVFRNCLLALLALIAAAPMTARVINAIDYLALIGASVVCVFIYAAINQLIANSLSMKPWLSKTRNITNG